MKFQEHPSNGIRDALGRILLHLKYFVSFFCRNQTQHSAGNVLRVPCVKFQENPSNEGRYTADKLVYSPSKLHRMKRRRADCVV
jgi:hypothetical protein